MGLVLPSRNLERFTNTIVVILNTMQTQQISWNRKAFRRLVLDEQSKELIRALVSVHLGSNATGDIIAGKGNGLIILLHGSPGVGKTLTAERYGHHSYLQSAL